LYKKEKKWRTERIIKEEKPKSTFDVWLQAAEEFLEKEIDERIFKVKIEKDERDLKK